MNEEEQTRRRNRNRLWIALGAGAALAAALIVPPMVSVTRYKSQIARLISASLGRPVHLSGVELRLLPLPGFVLSNLVVDEDPAYGFEPVLHAETVTATFRLLPLWRGKLEIGRISVDQASLNVVRMAGGRWNLDPLFRTAYAKAGATAGAPGRGAALPYLEATNSRIDFKNGVEKLPFSIVNADLSFWQEAPGDWHIRLRGEPARTDVSLDQEDTGVLRLEASLHSAPALREMPLHVDLDWQEAQLGQLSRLLIGSDPGWRGNLTADLHLEGTADTAHVTARLRASGVHRAEFAPAEPLDFDANCRFVYHYAHRSLDDLNCSSPLGDGHVRLAGDLPGNGQPHLTVALDQIPVDAGLAFLRTIRSGIDPSLTAAGTVSGKMTYTGGENQRAARTIPAAARHGRQRTAKQRLQAPPLAGNFTVEGFQITGDGISDPIRAARFTLEPGTIAPGGALGLIATANVPAGASAPLTFTPQLSLQGYQLAVRGEASLARARELAHLADIQDGYALDELTGEPVAVALNVEGSWLPMQTAMEGTTATAGSGEPSAQADPDTPPPGGDRLTGTVAIHNSDWRADYLAHRVVISEATLHLADGRAWWNPVDFSYGTEKGTASLTLPGECPPHPAGGPCPAHFAVQFGKLKAAALQSAVLGTRTPGSLLSTLIEKLHLSSAPAWPELDGTVKAESLGLGPVTLTGPAATLRIEPSGATIESLDAGVLGGQVHLTGTLTKPATDQGQPMYALKAKFEGLSAPAVGRLLDMRWSGGPINAEGRVQLSGLTAHDLAASAAGTLRFDWRRGMVAAMPVAAKAVRDTANAATGTPAPGRPERVPPALAHFSRFAGEAEIGDGKVTLRASEAVQGGRRKAVEGDVMLTDPPKVLFAEPGELLARKRQSGRPIQ